MLVVKINVIEVFVGVGFELEKWFVYCVYVVENFLGFFGF